jgi:hypothetical protein
MWLTDVDAVEAVRVNTTWVLAEVVKLSSAGMSPQTARMSSV